MRFVSLTCVGWFWWFVCFSGLHFGLFCRVYMLILGRIAVIFLCWIV